MRWRGWAILAVAGTAGCSVAAEPTPAASDETRTVHALIQVHRAESVTGETRADALAGFLRVPLSADPGQVFSMAGLREELPSAGHCVAAQLSNPTGEADPDAAGELGSLGVELVPADEITLTTTAGDHHLSPHAFPSVSDWIRGVVYTSRDQTPDSLPAGSLYTIMVRGADELGRVSTLQQSPESPASLTLAGLPLAEAPPISESFELTWAPSLSPLDVLTVAIRSGDAAYTCSFRDASGLGSVSLTEARVAFDQPVFRRGDAGTLTVHRVRTVAAAGQTDTSVVEVRFDFSVAADVTFE